MRSLVVFGRGGPRGPPARPRYLSQDPPRLKYSPQVILKGNPFEILASIPEKSSSKILNANESSTELDSTQESVVHQSEIPDSFLSPNSPKCSQFLQVPAPDFKIDYQHKTTDEYSMVVRGRKRSQYFNKKITQSKKFTQKLKESFSPKQLPFSRPDYVNQSPSPCHRNMTDPIGSQNQDSPESPSMEVDLGDEPQLSDDTDLEPLVTQPTITPNEFEITPEEEKALLDHDMAGPNPPQLSSLQKPLHTNTIQPNIERFFRRRLAQISLQFRRSPKQML